MSYAIIGFGKIGHALGKAFARKGIEVSVATTQDPKSFAADAAAIGPAIIPKTLGEAVKADTIFWLSISSRTRMSLRRCPPGDDRDAKALVVELIDSTGLVALDLGSLADGGAMQQLGGPLSAVELHFVRRIVR